jgi:hypothetical protein
MWSLPPSPARVVTDAAVAADAVNVMPTAAHTDRTESLLNIDVLPGSADATMAAGGSAGSIAGPRVFANPLPPPRCGGVSRPRWPVAGVGAHAKPGGERAVGEGSFRANGTAAHRNHFYIAY